MQLGQDTRACSTGVEKMYHYYCYYYYNYYYHYHHHYHC